MRKLSKEERTAKLARRAKHRAAIAKRRERLRGITLAAATRPRPSGQLVRTPATRAGRDPATGKSKPHDWNAKTAAEVARLAGLFFTDKEIALYVDVRPGKLRRLYATELLRGAQKVSEKVRKNAIRQSAGAPQMTTFLLEATQNFIRTERRQHTGDDDKPIVIKVSEDESKF